MPDPVSGEDPLPSELVNQIDRPSGVSAGSGDVYIAHAELTPTEDEVIYDPSSFPRGYRRIFFIGGRLEQPDYWNTIKFQLGNGYYMSVSQYDATRVSITVYAFVFSRFYRGEPRYRSLTDSYVSYYPSIDDSMAWSSAQSTLSSLRRQLALGLGREDRFYIYSGSASVISQSYIPSWHSRLHSYLLGREFGAHIGDSGIDAGLFYKSFYDATEKLPVLQQNMIANILECLSTLASFLDGFDASDIKDAKKTAKNLWLAYRYQYKTTVSDLEEVLDTLARLDSVAGKRVFSYGSASSGPVTAHCALGVQLHLPTTLKELCRQAGIRLTLANAWDMIPYSFVVDWFLKIGSCLEDLQKWMDADQIDISECWYSVFVSIDEPGTRGLEYARWLGNPPSLPYFSSHNVGARTIGMRIADAISLFG
jgi:hypothetical protein